MLNEPKGKQLFKDTTIISNWHPSLLDKTRILIYQHVLTFLTKLEKLLKRFFALLVPKKHFHQIN
jgi:hypothetical protein